MYNYLIAYLWLRSKHCYLVVILVQAQPQGDIDTTQEVGQCDINITLFYDNNAQTRL